MAGRAWAKGGLFASPCKEDDDAIADARALGLPAEAIADIEAALAQGDGFEGVWPDHEAAVAAFCVAGTQWRTAPLGMAGYAYVGLDYSAARDAWAMAGLETTPEVFAQIRLIEHGALGALNEARP